MLSVHLWIGEQPLLKWCFELNAQVYKNTQIQSTTWFGLSICLLLSATQWYVRCVRHDVCTAAKQYEYTEREDKEWYYDYRPTDNH